MLTITIMCLLINHFSDDGDDGGIGGSGMTHCHILEKDMDVSVLKRV